MKDAERVVISYKNEITELSTELALERDKSRSLEAQLFSALSESTFFETAAATVRM